MGIITDYILRELPRPQYFGGRQVTRFLRALSEGGDVLSQRILDARKEWTAETATRDALLALARNMNDRGFARESTTDLLAYLLRIIAEHRKKGTEYGLKAQFARIGCPDIDIVTELTLRDAGAVNPFGGNIGFFFIIIRQPNPFTFTYSSWDGDGEWDDGTSRWGWFGSADDLLDIGDILRRWKPAGSSCRFVLFDEDGTAGWTPLGLTGNYAQIPYNEPWETRTDGLVSAYYNTDFLTP